jgi:U3 small nucleolar RNA-associated protein 20
MVSHLDTTLLERYLIHILTPVYRIIDDNSIRDAHIGTVSFVREVLCR